MMKAFKYRFYPTEDQARQLAQTFGVVRAVWNWALETRETAFRERGEKLNYAMLNRMLTVWKNEPGKEWRRGPSSDCLQYALRHQEQAYRNWWGKRTRRPRFHNKHRKQTATYSSNKFRWDGTRSFKLAKMTRSLRVRWDRPLEGRPVAATVTYEPSRRYFISIQCEVDPPEQLPPSPNEVGVDLGITSFAVLSTGEKIAGPKPLQKMLVRLRRAERVKSRRKLGSNRRYQAVLHVAKLHARVADARADFLHKLSTRLIRENQTVVVEDLAVRNMVRNRHLARSISDAGWSKFVRQLTYKAQWYGRMVEKVGRFFPSSKTCSSCGHVLPELGLDVRQWACPECGTLHDRDVNAALNILAARSAVTARGGDVRPAARQAVFDEARTDVSISDVGDRLSLEMP